MTESDLEALKIAFTYMPQAIEVNEFDFAGRVEVTLEHISKVREALSAHGIDPDEVAGDVYPDSTPNSSY
jgi:hypothetical protein